MTKDKALDLAKEALENSLPRLAPYGEQDWLDSKAAITAIKQARSAPAQEPVAFLANGTRFKISYDSRQSGGQIHGIPQELGGRWVAFVAAEDDCHLKLTTPPAQPADTLTDGVLKITMQIGEIEVSRLLSLDVIRTSNAPEVERHSRQAWLDLQKASHGIAEKGQP